MTNSPSNNENQPTGTSAGNIISYFTQHRVAANLVMLLVIILGIGAIFSLKVQFFPDITSNQVTVSVIWPGANAEDVEQLITNPLESRIKQLDGVDKMYSYSETGMSRLWIDMLFSADMTEMEQKISSLVKGFSDYPNLAQTPVVQIRPFSEMTSVVVVSSDGPVEDLAPYVDKFKTELLNLGIADVQTNGLRNTRIQLEVSAETLLSMGKTIDQLADSIRQQNRNHSAGTVGQDFTEKAIKANNTHNELNDLSQLLIPQNRQGSLTTLDQVAKMQRLDVVGATKVFWEEKPSVTLFIFRDASIDTMDTNDILEQWLSDTQKELPKGLSVEIPYKTSDFVLGNLRLLINNGLLGLIFVTLMLFVFLNGRVAMWTAIGIPVSIFGTLYILQLTGGSINFLSMFGMLMALGIIVDDAIVVGEETVTQMEKGYQPEEAARRGALRMFTPVLASSLTTIAAFSPLLFLEGIAGEIFKPIPIVVISVIVASLFECFLILPGHLNHSFNKSQKKQKEPGRFRQAIDQKLFAFRDGPFRTMVSYCLHHRFITLALAIAFAIIAAGLVASNQVRFVGDPNVDDSVVTAFALLVDGTSEAQINTFSNELERALIEGANTLGNANDLILNKYIQYSEDERYIWMRVTLPQRDDRSFSNADFLEVWDNHVNRAVYVEEIEISQTQGESATDQTLSFFLAGDNIELLRLAATDLKLALRRYPDLKNITDDIPGGNEQILFEANAQARVLGLNDAAIASQIRSAVDGVTIQTFVRDNREEDLVISLNREDTNNLSVMEYLPILTPANTLVPLGNLVNLSTDTTLAYIRHENGQIGVKVTAAILDPDADLQKISKSIEANELQQIMDRYDLTSEIQGSNRELQQTLKELSIKGAIALFIMYLILAWVFSSYSWPFAVMSAIPLGLTGAVYGHWVMGFDMNVLSIFGFFGLAGIIVNDSIILISRYRELIAEGIESDDAIVSASCQRFRAVILTSITTVVGLIPILFESSVQAQLVQSMATSLAFGLAYGTLLVLVIIPCLLSLIESLKSITKNFFNRILSRA